MRKQDVIPVAYIVAGFFTGYHIISVGGNWILSLFSIFLWPLYWLTKI